MRRLIVFTALVALALTPSAGAGASLARYAAESGDSLSLRSGRGIALLVNRDGAVLGSVRRGRVTIADGPRGPQTKVSVSGCERKRYPRPRTVVCMGQGLRFSALGGTWRVRIAGGGINASAVMNGSVMLDNGTAGTYRIRDEPYRPWPASAQTFYLG